MHEFYPVMFVIIGIIGFSNRKNDSHKQKELIFFSISINFVTLWKSHRIYGYYKYITVLEKKKLKNFISQKTFINTLYSLKINNNNNSRCNEIRCTIQENIIQTFFANNIVMYLFFLTHLFYQTLTKYDININVMYKYLKEILTNQWIILWDQEGRVH